MKRLKTQPIWKASNVTFNEETLEAYSYSWWKFLGYVNGKLVFNDYRYSPSTGNHQRKVKMIIADLGIKPDIFIESKFGLDHPASMIDDAIRLLRNKIDVLESEIASPRSRAATNIKRRNSIQYLEKKIIEVENLLLTGMRKTKAWRLLNAK